MGLQKHLSTHLYLLRTLSPASLAVINPRRVCVARVTVLGLCVCLCVCVSVTQHLTFHVIICATNDTYFLSGG